MKKATTILLMVILFISVGLNIYFVFKYVLKGDSGRHVNSNKNECVYTGHWKAMDFLPELYIESDGTVYAASVSNKKSTESDPYSEYISTLLVGYCENDNIVITKKAKLYDPHILDLDGGDEYYFHSFDEVTEEYYETVAQIWTITSVTDNAIKISGFYPQEISYIRAND